MFQDKEVFLFLEWIAPNTFETFDGKTVLECGCGGGQHTAMMAPHAKSITAVDLNTADLVRERLDYLNVEAVDADLATMDLGRQFDIVICIGVIHHTDDPDATFRNIYRHCRPGGRVIIWTYSAEGNALVRFVVEPIRKMLLARMSRNSLSVIATILTAGIYPFIYTVYRLPFLKFLPYYDYFANARRMSFHRNMINVFDKLNAPQTRFTTRAKCDEWFNATLFVPSSISIRPYVGVSYSLSGIKRSA